MNRDDVLRMAREAGFEVHDRKQHARVGMDAMLGIDSTAKLERFAALVASAEREECAVVAESGFRFALDGYQIADSIRARTRKAHKRHWQMHSSAVTKWQK